MSKPTWDEYFLDIAVAVAERSSCVRRKVGAVIVDTDHRIVSTGYNDSEPGGLDCMEGCPRAMSNVAPGSTYSEGPGTCIAVHAEANAVVYAGRARAMGCTMYCTERPCFDCSKLIAAAGLARVVVLGAPAEPVRRPVRRD